MLLILGLSHLDYAGEDYSGGERGQVDVDEQGNEFVVGHLLDVDPEQLERRVAHGAVHEPPVLGLRALVHLLSVTGEQPD